ncbi:DUF300-domain-containing protein [Rickenella mellea]|uniref:DUF300-domain-containing protein n=1 Tax=Rickenella mellea TaxID=50990 RepID=A0A4Y7PZP8_9AGAM|nr:DUF300-domain-containing protein [Rickenella mellea]
MSIYLQLKNYRKPLLQRMVVRIMLMVPIYAISSLIALFSLEAAFVIDAIRDIYEAFVIYCFFNLLLGYLGGERSLLILLHGREPKPSVFPFSLINREIDVSDPYTFLFLKRGILQYVQVKPVLALATLILKAVGKYNEGTLRATSGYLYVSIVYNISICLSLYCLAMFWLCVNEDLQPFRPMPKFLCVKGILFFSFWQSILVSILVAAGAIKQLGPYTDHEHISLGLTDTLICFEMPFFAVAHMYAFSHTDYIDRGLMYAARMPMYYAMRDAFGLKDVVEDSKATLRGEGMDYRTFEPAEGFIHQGSGRDRRIKAGLRYSQGGQKKYWLPMPADSTQPRDHGTVNTVITRMVGGEEQEEVYAPLLQDQVDGAVHDAIGYNPREWEEHSENTGFDLPFGDPDAEDDALFEHSKNFLFGDYYYPCIDVSSEYAKSKMWEEEERILHDERAAYFSPIRGPRLLREAHRVSYGAVSKTNLHTNASEQRSFRPDMKSSTSQPTAHTSNVASIPSLSISPDKNPGNDRLSSSHASSSRQLSEHRLSPSPKTHPDHSDLPHDAVDLVVENDDAAEDDMNRERRKGEPAVRGSGLRKVYTRGYHMTDHDRQDSNPVDEPAHQAISVDSVTSQRTEPAEVIEEVEGEVARAVTPPLHTQLSFNSYVDHSNDGDNPWT